MTTESGIITNLFLYGQANTPGNLLNDNLIRPATVTPPVYQVDLSDFMTTGGGRFAVGRQFELVNRFFTESIAPGTYSKDQMATMLGLNTFAGKTWSMQQYNFRDDVDDYAERTYIFNTMSFQIMDGATFIVEGNGQRRIENFAIIPTTTVQENFDFSSSNRIAQIGNTYLESHIDPFELGRTVNINFTGTILTTTYDGDSYHDDLVDRIARWGGFSPSKLMSDIADLQQSFWDAGITKFLDEDGRPIYYGSVEGDALTADAINAIGTPHLLNYKRNGISFLGGEGSDDIRGSDYDDRLYGGVGHDTLNGGAGNDSFYGGAGNDSINGGRGLDTASYEDSPVAVNVSLVGSATGGTASGDTLTSIENLIASAHDDTLTGDDGNNTLDGAAGNDAIFGGKGNDLLIGGVGADTLIGGEGSDTVSYAKSSAAVNVNLNSATAQSGGEATGDVLTSIENVIGSALNDTLTGNSENNHLVGGAGNDTLNAGSSGIDVLQGGSGDDLYVLNNVNDERTITIDDIDGRISIRIPGVQFGITSGTGNPADNFYGCGTKVAGDYGKHIFIEYDDANNMINIHSVPRIWNDRDDWTLIAQIKNVGYTFVVPWPLDPTPLESHAWTDTLEIAYTYSGSDVTGDALDNTIIGSTSENATLRGGAGNDYLIGDPNDVLYGDAGNDTLDGGPDADTLYGGTENDTYIVDHVGDVVIEYADEGIDTVQTSISYTLGSNVEDLILTGTAAISGTGNSYDNWIEGNSGNNTLAGGAGADTINGGLGFDRVDYTASTAINVNFRTNINTGGDAANDILLNIEEIRGSNFDDTITGANLAMSLIGGAGKDHITGGDDNDTIDGGDGVDTIFGGSGDDLLIDSAGVDNIDGGYGIDTASYAATTTAAFIDLNSGNPWLFSGTPFDIITNVENAIGSNFNDSIAGNGENNLLNGGDGNDTIFGLNGNDTIYGSSGIDAINAGLGDDLIIGGAGGDYINGDVGNDTVSYAGSTAAVSINLATGAVSGGDATSDTLLNIENVIGSDLGDTLIGNSGNNRLDGGNGNDTLAGGAGTDALDGAGGADTYIISNSGTAATIHGFASGSDKIDLRDFAQVSLMSHLTIQPNGASTIISIPYNSGGSFVLTLLATQAVTLTADDFIMLPSTVQTLTGTTGADLLVGGTANDSLSGGDGNDTITAGVGNDTVNGGANNDLINSGFGSDQIDGGAGNDTVSYATGPSAVTADIGSGNPWLFTTPLLDTIINVENLTGSNFSDSLAGNSGANIITGGDGNDTIFGMAGNDTIYGGNGADAINAGDGDDLIIGGAGGDYINGANGNDTLSYAGSAIAVHVELSTAYVDGGDAISDSLVSIENLIGSSFNDTLLGGADNNRLDGANGNDRLAGGAGVDTLTGGAGIDTFVISDSATATTITDFVHGTDQINLRDFLRVGSLSDITIAQTGANTTITVPHNSTGSMTLTLLGVTASTLTLSDFVVLGPNDVGINGTAGANVLTGGIGNDVIYGYAGNDTITGGAGNDTLDGGQENDLFISGFGFDHINGGPGIDTVSYATVSAGIYTDLGSGDPYLFSGATLVDLISNMENAIGSNYNDSIAGNNEANSLSGGNGADTLFGLAGNDTLNGGAGGDAINAGTGDDVLIGGAGADYLNGADGNDTVSYVGSSAAVTVNLITGTATGGDAAGDTLVSIESIIGTAFHDTLYGGNDANRINGADGNDSIRSGEGNDTIIGGGGADFLDAGLGQDYFVYNYAYDSGLGATNRDLINDFSVADDIFDFSSFAGTFTFVGTNGFSGNGSQIRYVAMNDTTISVDSDGNGVADFEIQLIGAHELTSNNFIL